MVSVNVRDKDEISLRQPGNVGRLGWIEIDVLSARLYQQSSVIDRRDFHGTLGRLEFLGLASGLSVCRHCESGNESQCGEPHSSFHLYFLRSVFFAKTAVMLTHVSRLC